MPAPPKNTNAAKPDAEKVSGLGRITADLGPLKARMVRAAQAKDLTLVKWLRKVVEQALKRQGF